MKIRVLALLLLAALSSSSPVIAREAAGTVSFTCGERLSNRIGGFVWRCSFTWVSDGSGNVNTNPKTIPYGSIIRAEWDPASGADAPTDNYDVTLVDTSGVDLLMGTGADRDTANTEVTLFGTPIYQDGKRDVDLTIANAGATNGGVFTIWVRQPTEALK